MYDPHCAEWPTQDIAFNVHGDQILVRMMLRRARKGSKVDDECGQVGGEEAVLLLDVIESVVQIDHRTAVPVQDKVNRIDRPAKVH